MNDEALELKNYIHNNGLNVGCTNHSMFAYKEVCQKSPEILFTPNNFIKNNPQIKEYQSLLQKEHFQRLQTQ